MRWIKHMTATRRDEKICRLISEHGHAGYGLWWMVCEIVAASIEGGSAPSVTYPVSEWSHLLSLRGSHVRQAIVKLELTHLVTTKWTGSELTVTIPNLLKYRDEYSQRSGHHRDALPSKKQIQKQKQKQKQKEHKPPAAPVAGFEEFWEAYWRKVSKIRAQKAYEKKVTTPELHAAVMAGVSVQRYTMLQRETEKQPHAATWLNERRWEDDPGGYGQPPPTSASRRAVAAKADAEKFEIAYAAWEVEHPGGSREEFADWSVEEMGGET